MYMFQSVEAITMVIPISSISICKHHGATEVSFGWTPPRSPDLASAVPTQTFVVYVPRRKKRTEQHCCFGCLRISKTFAYNIYIYLYVCSKTILVLHINKLYYKY